MTEMASEETEYVPVSGGRAILLFGYAGRRAMDLAAYAHRHNAVVLDIRNEARSSQPGWNDFQLVPLMGRRYQRCRAWGNVNYKDRTLAPEIIDFDRGWADCQELRTGPGARMVILVCVCRVAKGCHRSIIERMIFDHAGIRCGHLELPDAPVSPKAKSAAPESPQVAMAGL